MKTHFFTATLCSLPNDAVVNAVRFDYGWLGAIVSAVLLVGVLMMDVEKYLAEIRAALGEKKMPM